MKCPGHPVLALAAMIAGALLLPRGLHAQYDTPASAPAPQTPSAPQLPPAAKPANAQPARPAQANSSAASGDDAVLAAGGPGADTGGIAIPKKTPPAEPPPPADNVKNPPGLQNLALHVNVPLVNVDVGVLLEKNHEFVPNLQKENFRVFEDGVPQRISHFSQIKAPITAVLLCEFASTNYEFLNDMKNAAYAFAKQLQPEDSVAVVTYDMHTEIVTDFTQDKQKVLEALDSLSMPLWRETNLFDALYSTLDRLTRVPGRKYVILISSGVDTFSKITLDKMLEKIRSTPNVTIYSVSTGQFARLMHGVGGVGIGGMRGVREMTYLQGDNQLSHFASMTGGRFFAPRFEGELPDIFTEINESIRNEYLLTYTPTNTKQDGKYRHLQVELVDEEGHPLRMQDQKHHPLKYDVIAKDGYRASLPVE
jgi:VWFA-related protein